MTEKAFPLAARTAAVVAAESGHRGGSANSSSSRGSRGGFSNARGNPGNSGGYRSGYTANNNNGGGRGGNNRGGGRPNTRPTIAGPVAKVQHKKHSYKRRKIAVVHSHEEKVIDVY
jgi:hypothetical protein